MPPWAGVLVGSSGSGLGTGAPSVLRAKQMTKCGFRPVGGSGRASPQGHAALSGCPAAPRRRQVTPAGAAHGDESPLC